jgi:hypothetical protein
MALTFMVCATHAMAQDQTGTLVGKVSDSASAPVSSAMLHVLDSRTGTVSGDDGRYRIVGIAPGQHSVIVRRQGFVTDTFVVTIGAAQSVEHDIVLRAFQWSSDRSSSPRHRG